MGLEARGHGLPTESLEMRRGVPDPRALVRLARLVRGWRPDVVHSHMVHANLMARALRLVTPVSALVSTIHNIYEGGPLLMAAYRLTNGLVGHRLPGLPPMLLLEHVGAKSGRRRTTPLAYVADGANVAIIASKGGHPRHPAWFHNLLSHPVATVQIGARRRRVVARVAEGEERERLWSRALEGWAQYADYQERTDRRIPLVILERR
jgi:deazaflavin-dependent oxidoreductase (nitroreductase family)